MEHTYDDEKTRRSNGSRPSTVFASSPVGPTHGSRPTFKLQPKGRYPGPSSLHPSQNTFLREFWIHLQEIFSVHVCVKKKILKSFLLISSLYSRNTVKKSLGREGRQHFNNFRNRYWWMTVNHGALLLGGCSKKKAKIKWPYFLDWVA
jgi:hypothetical protein